MPAPPEAELPRLYREVEALRLRNHMDPKRFYRRDEGEGKGIKGLPKYFSVSAPLFIHYALANIVPLDGNYFAYENTLWHAYWSQLDQGSSQADFRR